MNPVFEKMYSDSLIIEEIKESMSLFVLTSVGEAISKWEYASGEIEKLIPRIGSVDMDSARELFESWKYTREEKDDFRILTSRMENVLLPSLIRALNSLYAPIDMEGIEYSFHKSRSGFMNVRDNKTGRFLHDPDDPMHEAHVLAENLYSPDMDSFHIFGCGLGYLAYQIWERSERSAHIYIYEEDASMIEYASQIGVLSMIDPASVTIVDNTDVNEMLLKFDKVCESGSQNRYISDWKVGTHEGTKPGELISEMDFNDRTTRNFGFIQKINIRENSKQELHEIELIRGLVGKKKREVIVVSAGPSLNDCIEFIRKGVEDKIVICINAALKRMQREKIIPDLAVALDSKRTLYSHIEGIEEYTKSIPLVMALETSYAFVKKYRGPKYVLRDPDKKTSGFEWCFGGTVSSLALDIAFFLGAEKVYLVGSDLAFSKNKNYADGVAHAVSEGMRDSMATESTDGGKVATTRLYCKYREMIESQIALHKECRVYNMASHGAKIKGTYTPEE